MLRKKSNSAYYLTRERYQDFIDEVKQLKNKWDKSFYDFKTLANYDVLQVGDREKLIQPKDESNSTVKFYVPTDELFGVLHTMHLLLNHPTLEDMQTELKTKYCNISKEVIKIYMETCKVCSKRLTGM